MLFCLPECIWPRRLTWLLLSYVYFGIAMNYIQKDEICIFQKFILSHMRFWSFRKYWCSHVGPMRLHADSIKVQTNCSFQNLRRKSNVCSFSPQKGESMDIFCPKVHINGKWETVTFSLSRCIKYMHQHFSLIETSKFFHANVTIYSHFLY